MSCSLSWSRFIRLRPGAWIVTAPSFSYKNRFFPLMGFELSWGSRRIKKTWVWEGLPVAVSTIDERMTLSLSPSPSLSLCASFLILYLSVCLSLKHTYSHSLFRTQPLSLFISYTLSLYICISLSISLTLIHIPTHSIFLSPFRSLSLLSASLSLSLSLSRSLLHSFSHTHAHSFSFSFPLSHTSRTQFHIKNMILIFTIFILFLSMKSVVRCS